MNLRLEDVKVVKLKISLEFVGTLAEVKVVWVKILHFVFMAPLSVQNIISCPFISSLASTTKNVLCYIIFTTYRAIDSEMARCKKYRRGIFNENCVCVTAIGFRLCTKIWKFVTLPCQDIHSKKPLSI